VVLPITAVVLFPVFVVLGLYFGPDLRRSVNSSMQQVSERRANERQQRASDRERSSAYKVSPEPEPRSSTTGVYGPGDGKPVDKPEGKVEPEMEGKADVANGAPKAANGAKATSEPTATNAPKGTHAPKAATDAASADVSNPAASPVREQAAAATTVVAEQTPPQKLPPIKSPVATTFDNSIQRKGEQTTLVEEANKLTMMWNLMGTEELDDMVVSAAPPQQKAAPTAGVSGAGGSGAHGVSAALQAQQRMAHMWTEMGLDGDPAAAVQDGLEVAAPAPSGKLTMAPVGQLAGSSSSRPPATSTMAPVGSKPVTPAPASSLAGSGRSAASSGGSLSFNPGVRPGTPAETYSAIIEDSLREIATLSASPACAASSGGRISPMILGGPPACASGGSLSGRISPGMLGGTPASANGMSLGGRMSPGMMMPLGVAGA